jgi:hypothetical protein
MISRLATKILYTPTFDLPIPVCYVRYGAI